MLKKRAGDSKGKIIELFRTILLMVILSFILRFSVFAAHQTLMQQGIADEVLRFHVLANSDSEEDQRVKYLVRDEVLDWLQSAIEKADTGMETIETDAGMETIAAHIREGAEGTDTGTGAAETDVDAAAGGRGISSSSGRQQTLDFLSEHLDKLEQKANQVLAREGADYRAEAVIETCWFPDRTYGECTFPAGYYKALRLKLGKAQGQNWWCVLYPRLCFQDCVHAVVEEEQMAQLEEVLTEEEYEALLKKPSDWKIAFGWF